MSRRKIRKGSPITPKERAKWGWGVLVFSAIFNQCVVISRKWCILDTKLLWDGNRKPYANYRMVSVSMTLRDPSPGFHGQSSFKRRVSPKRRILQTQLLYRTPQATIGTIDRQAFIPVPRSNPFGWQNCTFFPKGKTLRYMPFIGNPPS